MQVSDTISRELKILSLNIRAMQHKKDELLQLLQKSKTDIVLLQETWMKPDYSIVLPRYHTPFEVKRSGQRGGGLAIYVRDNLRAKNVPQFTMCNSDLEVISTMTGLKQQTLSQVSS